MKFTISDEIKQLCQNAALGILHYKVQVEPSPAPLLEVFEHTIQTLSSEYTLDAVAMNPHIAATRQAYKALGKSPQEYRNAAEAMLRRVVKQAGLYHINNVVEINNLISISSGYSIGSYDVSALEGDIRLCRAEDGARYGGIGKGSVNIEHLPVLYDDLGPFGNPTSDSRRAMIQEGEREILSILYSFDGTEPLKPWMEKFRHTLQQYSKADEIETWLI